MRTGPDNTSETARALEHKLEINAEAAKRAIRDFKKTILHNADLGGVRQIERRNEDAVKQYMQIRKKRPSCRSY